MGMGRGRGSASVNRAVNRVHAFFNIFTVSEGNQDCLLMTWGALDSPLKMDLGLKMILAWGVDSNTLKFSETTDTLHIGSKDQAQGLEIYRSPFSRIPATVTGV